MLRAWVDHSLPVAPQTAVAVGIGGLAGSGPRWGLIEVLPATDV